MKLSDTALASLLASSLTLLVLSACVLGKRRWAVGRSGRQLVSPQKTVAMLLSPHLLYLYSRGLHPSPLCGGKAGSLKDEGQGEGVAAVNDEKKKTDVLFFGV